MKPIKAAAVQAAPVFMNVKGLEFEAGIFVSIDQLVQLQTELSEKSCRGPAQPHRLGTLAPSSKRTSG